jgi:hypothetical protein
MHLSLKKKITEHNTNRWVRIYIIIINLLNAGINSIWLKAKLLIKTTTKNYDNE